MSHNSRSGTFFSCITLLFFCVAGFQLVSTYHHRWEFGRYGMPVTRFGQDVNHFADGTPINHLIQQIALADCEPEIWLVLLSVVTICGLGTAYLCLDTERKRKLIEESAKQLAEMYRAERQRRGQPRS